MSREVVADIVHYMHYLLVAAVFASFLLPPGEWLKWNIIIIAIVLLDWNDDDEQCVLTALESKLRGTWQAGSTRDNDSAPAFWQPWVNTILAPFGREVDGRGAYRLNYIMFLVALLVSLGRYCVYRRIKFFGKGRTWKIYMASFTFLGILWIANASWNP